MRHVVDASPLSEPVFFILASLAAESKHGYALLKDIERISQGRVRLSTGTLYGAIRRLLDEDLIERIQTDDTSRDKQTYQITTLGRDTLEAEHTRLKQLTRITTALLRAREA
jgi:DNA-binding PadR family transcriptional regulator